jgi:hypothetical protein
MYANVMNWIACLCLLEKSVCLTDGLRTDAAERRCGSEPAGNYVLLSLVVYVPLNIR